MMMTDGRPTRAGRGTRLVLPLAAPLAFADLGCAVRTRSVLSPGGPAARTLADLGWPVLIGFSVTSLVMAALIVWLLMRRTGTFAAHAPVDAGGGLGWVVVGGLVLPGIAFTAVFIATLGVLSAFPMNHGRPPSPSIRVTGHQWWWDIEYLIGDLPQHFRTANELHLPVDQPVDIELVTADVIHSFWVPRLHGKIDLIPGLRNHIRIQASTPGVYEGECAEFCGLQHTKMRFQVVADEPAAFVSWLEQQRRPGAAVADEAARRGAQVFRAGACPMCHAVIGTGALAGVGPDLTHVGSRRSLAAGSLVNDVANLHAWVVNAPSLKPGTQMPALTQLTGPQLHDLVAYLEALQ
jgi:cytochrome c oxidase subunit 2